MCIGLAGHTPSTGHAVMRALSGPARLPLSRLRGLRALGRGDLKVGTWGQPARLPDLAWPVPAALLAADRRGRGAKFRREGARPNGFSHARSKKANEGGLSGTV